MVHALRYLRGDIPAFETDTYDWETVCPYENDIREILSRRQLSASEDWKALGQRITGYTIEDFDLRKYQQEYMNVPKEEKDDTFLGKFITAAMEQKSMVAKSIAASGNRLVGLRRSTE